VCRVAAPAAGSGKTQQQHLQSNASASLQVGVRIPSRIGTIGACFTQNKVPYARHDLLVHLLPCLLNSSSSSSTSPPHYHPPPCSPTKAHYTSYTRSTSSYPTPPLTPAQLQPVEHFFHTRHSIPFTIHLIPFTIHLIPFTIHLIPFTIHAV
jgi:hypothetical protein